MKESWTPIPPPLDDELYGWSVQAANGEEVCCQLTELAARQIAEVPEMVEALEAITAYFSRVGEEIPAIEDARAILARTKERT